MRRLRFRDTSGESTFELNLAPMMDMMVSIIPFMLLSATFLQLMLISTPLPVPVAKALEQDREKDKREVSIKLTMSRSKDMMLEVKDVGGAVTKVAVPKTSGEFDYNHLHKKLVEVKLRYPKVFRVELNPENQVDYNSIVRVMDASRNMQNADPKVKIDGADTPLLFPDVILGNVMAD